MEYMTFYSIEYGKEEFTRESWYLYIKRDNTKARTLHRLDGPAIHDKDGYKEWHVNGKGYPTRDAWLEAVEIFKLENK